MIRRPPTLDMLPDGTFRAPPRPPTVPFSAKLMLGAVIVAALAASAAVAFLALWVISLILPVLIISAAVAWLMFKFRRWNLGASPAQVVDPYNGRRFRN